MMIPSKDPPWHVVPHRCVVSFAASTIWEWRKKKKQTIPFNQGLACTKKVKSKWRTQCYIACYRFIPKTNTQKDTKAEDKCKY